MPVETRSVTIKKLEEELQKQKSATKILEKQIKKLQNINFFSCATEHEIEAIRDLTNWLIEKNDNGDMNIVTLRDSILQKKYVDPNFTPSFYDDAPSIGDYLMDAIGKRKMTPYRVWIALYSHRPEEDFCRAGDIATELEYGYLVTWLNENLEELYNLLVKSKYVFTELEEYKDRHKGFTYRAMYKLIKQEIMNGRLTPLRYDRNYSRLLH